MPSNRIVLQKLLTGGMAGAVVQDGLDEVAGTVVGAADASSLRTPAEILAAYGFDEQASTEPEFIDVVRFAQPVLGRLSVPSAHDTSRPWPTYPTGFLRASTLVPVWNLARTRYPVGAEYWRIRSDGEQKPLSIYAGTGRGWRGAKGWRPPARFVGTKARWQGVEYVADVDGDQVLLTLGEDDGPDGFEMVRPRIWVRAVPIDECEVFEIVATANVGETPVRVLEADGTNARVELVSDDPENADRIGATLTEPGIFEAVVPMGRLAGLQVVANELVPAEPAPHSSDTL